MTEARTLLPAGVGRDEVDAAADALGWTLVNVHRSADGHPREVYYAAADGEGLVVLVEEESGDARSLVAHAHDPERLLEAALAALPEVRPPELRASPEEAPASVEPASLPVRPRLADTVHCGRHLVDGVTRVVVHDFRANVRVDLDESRYVLLTHADGTRDLDGLSLAASAAGIYGGEAGVRDLLTQLNDAGLLMDGLPLPARPSPVAPVPAERGRPLEALPGYRFQCDGRGSCCRFYGMVTFSAAEATRALAHAERLTLPLAPEHAFTPYQGAQFEDDGTRVVAQVNGRCLFLDEDSGCGLHRVGGASAKPYACRTYPSTVVDDGTALRVSVGPECACVFRSVGRADGEPLLPLDATTGLDLPPHIPWLALPDPVPLTATDTATRLALRAWADVAAEALAAASDVPRAAFALSTHLVETVADPSRIAEVLARPHEPDRARLGEWLRALRVSAEGAAARLAKVRSERDLNVRVARWIAAALEDADVDALLAARATIAHEQFYLRVLTWGHRLQISGRFLQHGLFDRGVRLLVARAMAARPLRDPAADPPLALLEAAMRNLSLADYADG